MSRYDEEEHVSAPADDVHPNEVWTGWVNEGKRPGSPLAAFAAQWEKKGPPLREPLRELPMIIDTDIGDDPDDTFAVIAAARAVKNLALVVTCDEQDGKRASLARHVLSLVDRDDVPVIAGTELGNTTSLSGLATPYFEPPSDLVARVVHLAERTPGEICWLGLGPMSNLALLLRECPELAPRIRLIQMGGALKLGRREHNIRLDVSAAQFVLSKVIRPKFVLLDTTAHEENALTEVHPLVTLLAEQPSPWARLLTEQCKYWFRTQKRTCMHDPLALSAALELPLVMSAFKPLKIMDDGQFVVASERGFDVFHSTSARYGDFFRWLTETLGLSRDIA